MCDKHLVLPHIDCIFHNKSEKNKERRPPSGPNLHYFGICFPATPHCKEEAVRDCAEQTPLMPPLRGGMEEVPDGPQPPDGPPLPGNSGKEEEGKIEKENNFEQKRTEPGPLAGARDEAARAGTLPCSSPPPPRCRASPSGPGRIPRPRRAMHAATRSSTKKIRQTTHCEAGTICRICPPRWPRPGAGLEHTAPAGRVSAG